MLNVMGSGSEDTEDKKSPLLRNIAVVVVIGVLGYFVYRTIKAKTNEG
jgi:hypothetical protein